MTYSLSVTGVNANQCDACGTAAKVLTLADANARAGAQQLAMAQGTAFLCKNPDGSSTFYRLDAERSTPANPVLIAVGP